MNESFSLDPEQVFCEVCLKQLPRSDAAMAEARDYVAYFCGLDCYDRWQQRSAPGETQAAEPQVHAGHGRSKSRDERLKRAVKRHPQRDEPRVDSVEPEEVPPP